MLEFSLVGVPFLFVLVSTFEMARGMWLYHTLAYAVKEGTRYAVVHGQNCATAPNACTVTVGQIASRIRDAGTGLLPSQLNVTLKATGNADITCNLSDCLTNTTIWPAAPGSTPGNNLQISAVYPFKSALAMFWPGAGHTSFGTFNLPAASREAVQF